MTTGTQVVSTLRLALPLPRVRGVALFGVPVSLDVWAYLGAALAAWTIADGILPVAAPGRGVLAYAAAGAGAAALLLVSLALHETAHGVAARRAGLGVTGAVLSLAGGATVLREPPRTPGDELRIAVAGPAASLACAAAAAGTHVALVESGADPLVAAVAAVVATGNSVIGMLNLLPGLPLDGGRALRAALWAVTGREAMADAAAHTAGRIIGALLVGLALVASSSGDAALAIWLGFVGLAIVGARR